MRAKLLPLSATLALLTVGCDRLDPGSDSEFRVGVATWTKWTLPTGSADYQWVDTIRGLVTPDGEWTVTDSTRYVILDNRAAKPSDGGSHVAGDLSSRCGNPGEQLDLELDNLAHLWVIPGAYPGHSLVTAPTRSYQKAISAFAPASRDNEARHTVGNNFEIRHMSPDTALFGSPWQDGMVSTCEGGFGFGYQYSFEVWGTTRLCAVTQSTHDAWNDYDRYPGTSDTQRDCAQVN